MNKINYIGYVLCFIMSVSLYGADNTDLQSALIQAFKESSMYAVLKTSSDEKHDTYAEYEASSEGTSESHDLSEDTDSGVSDSTSYLLRQLYRHADHAIIVPKSIAYIIKQLEKHDIQLQDIASQQNAQQEQIRNIMFLLDHIEQRIDIVSQHISLRGAASDDTELSIQGSTIKRIPHKKE